MAGNSGCDISRFTIEPTSPPHGRRNSSAGRDASGGDDDLAARVALAALGEGVGEPVLGDVVAAADAAEQAVVDVADQLSQMGAAVFVNSQKAQRANVLPIVRTDHWLTDPIASIVSFYGLVEHVATLQGINPDAPRHLNKVTETV